MIMEVAALGPPVRHDHGRQAAPGPARRDSGEADGAEDRDWGGSVRNARLSLCQCANQGNRIHLMSYMTIMALRAWSRAQPGCFRVSYPRWPWLCTASSGRTCYSYAPGSPMAWYWVCQWPMPAAVMVASRIQEERCVVSSGSPSRGWVLSSSLPPC